MINPSEILATCHRHLGLNVFALLSGYPASCFARVEPDRLEMPPGHEGLLTGPYDLPWSLFTDVRIFSEKGDIHLWRAASAWDMRTHRDLSSLTTIKRVYPVLGKPPRPDDIECHRGGWVLCKEMRGPSVWVPFEHAEGPHRRPALIVHQVLTTNAMGLYGVTDAVIAGFAKPTEKCDA